MDLEVLHEWTNPNGRKTTHQFKTPGGQRTGTGFEVELETSAGKDEAGTQLMSNTYKVGDNDVYVIVIPDEKSEAAREGHVDVWEIPEAALFDKGLLGTADAPPLAGTGSFHGPPQGQHGQCAQARVDARLPPGLCRDRRRVEGRARGRGEPARREAGAGGGRVLRAGVGVSVVCVCVGWTFVFKKDSNSPKTHALFKSPHSARARGARTARMVSMRNRLVLLEECGSAPMAKVSKTLILSRSSQLRYSACAVTRRSASVRDPVTWATNMKGKSSRTPVSTS